MEEQNVVDRLYNEFKELIEYLDKNKQLHFHNTATENFKKIILLAAASYFEDRVIDSILKFVREISQDNPAIVKFVEKKAISRQYHTYFKWDNKAKNANNFFNLFGSSFGDFMKKEVKNDVKLSEAIKKFIEIGLYRNQLVHQNFAEYSLDRGKTPEEIYQDYKEALYFVNIIPFKLREFCANENL